MSTAKYRTPEAFRQALEARIAKRNAEIPRGTQRYRQRCIFERFLARVVARFGDRAVLKGGVALELLLQRARMTQDIDLGLRARPDDLLLDLRRAGQLDLGDFLSFEVEPHQRHPTIANEGMLYEGQRFRVEARLAGKLYGQPFGLDVALGEPMPLPPETRTGDDLLAFIGIEPVVVRAYAREVHVAEKLHAFTMPRTRENSRVKDLPDIALLATTGTVVSARLRGAIGVTFESRGTHPVPQALPRPPESWVLPYARMALQNDLPWPALEEVFARAGAFLDPVLRGEEGTWDPASWRWEPSS